MKVWDRRCATRRIELVNYKRFFLKRDHRDEVLPTNCQFLTCVVTGSKGKERKVAPYASTDKKVIAKLKTETRGCSLGIFTIRREFLKNLKKFRMFSSLPRRFKDTSTKARSFRLPKEIITSTKVCSGSVRLNDDNKARVINFESWLASF